MIHLVLGGRRSGKSRFAQSLARQLTDRPVYLATSRRWDADHAARIARHRADRGPEWTTVEEELRLSAPPLEGRVVVIDCLTLWLTNLFVDHGRDATAALEEAKSELDRTVARPGTWILVSNEVGLGLHAATEAGRKFADIQGWLNQHAAARADRVTWMVAGLPVAVKGGG